MKGQHLGQVVRRHRPGRRAERRCWRASSPSGRGHRAVRRFLEGGKSDRAALEQTGLLTDGYNRAIVRLVHGQSRTGPSRLAISQATPGSSEVGSIPSPVSQWRRCGHARRGGGRWRRSIPRSEGDHRSDRGKRRGGPGRRREENHPQVARQDLEPGGIHPDLMRSDIWKPSLASTAPLRGVQQIGWHLPLLLGIRVRIRQGRLIEAGGNADMSQSNVFNMAVDLVALNDQMRALDTEIDARTPNSTQLSAAALRHRLRLRGTGAGHLDRTDCGFCQLPSLTSSTRMRSRSPSWDRGPRFEQSPECGRRILD